MPDMRPWGRRPLTIPPNSANAWIQLAIWELWMGMLVCVILGLGVLLIVTSPDRIVAVSDLTNCYAPPPVALPCERIVYRGGVLERGVHGALRADADRRRRMVAVGAVERGRAEADHRRLPAAAQRLVRPRLAQPAQVAVGATAVGVRLHARRRDADAPVVGMMIWTLVALGRLGQDADDPDRHVTELQTGPVASLLPLLCHMRRRSSGSCRINAPSAVLSGPM